MPVRRTVQNKLLAIRPIKALVIFTVINPLNFKFVNSLRPPCSRCGRPLLLTRIEPDEPGFDLRTYFCAHCTDNETIIAPV